MVREPKLKISQYAVERGDTDEVDDETGLVDEAVAEGSGREMLESVVVFETLLEIVDRGTEGVRKTE